jgi:hypothetical protein
MKTKVTTQPVEFSPSPVSPIEEVTGHRHLWAYSLGGGLLNFNTGISTHSFRGQLGVNESEMERVPDVPLPDFFINSRQGGTVQVIKANERLIHFIMLDGYKNPTYEFQWQSHNKWRAILKPGKTAQRRKFKRSSVDPIGPIRQADQSFD